MNAQTGSLNLLGMTIAVTIALGGCATFSPDGGFGTVEQVARERLGKDLQWSRTEADRDALDQRVAALLAGVLSVDDAVQVALLNNRGLQASFYELGITEAELVQTGRLANPGFSFGRLRRGDEVEIERGLHFSLARLLAMPLAIETESRRFERVKRDLAGGVVELAAATRKGWIQAVATGESVRYLRQVAEAAEAGAELARRMERTGNWNRLRSAREQSFYAEATADLARAEHAQRAARERLARLMGLWGPQIEFRLPERLPDLPGEPADLPDLERTALTQRLDVQAARIATGQLAGNLGLTKATRFVNVLELGIVRNSSNEAPTQRGWELRFELPIFDWGDARVARAEAIYMQALHRAAETAINARSEVREAWNAYRGRFDIARHTRDEIVPLRKRISEENLLRYNGMLIGVFELLADARLQIAAVNGYIGSLRDFWMAQADLQTALLGRPSLAPAAGPAMTTGAMPAGGH